jgi:hypothetical protein
MFVVNVEAALFYENRWFITVKKRLLHMKQPFLYNLTIVLPRTSDFKIEANVSGSSSKVISFPI